MYSLHHINDDDNCTAHQKFTASSLLDTPLQTHMAGALTLYKTASSSDVSPSSTKRKLVEPWLSTVLHFISKIRQDVQKPLIFNPGGLSHTQRALYEFVHQQLDTSSTKRPHQITKLDEFEISVALSGIINSRLKNVNNFFSMELLDRITSSCLRTRSQILQSEQIQKDRKSRTENLLMAGVLDTILYLSKAKPSISMYEAKVVSIWEHVIYYLSNQSLELISGEIPCRATKYQTSSVGLGLDLDFSKSTGGKRPDLQCRLGDLELNNCEFKRCDANSSKLEQQFPKNILIRDSKLYPSIRDPIRIRRTDRIRTEGQIRS
ncbi:hypothetical protein BGX20_001120, partial [Mortierella sp. AD010]